MTKRAALPALFFAAALAFAADMADTRLPSRQVKVESRPTLSASDLTGFASLAAVAETNVPAGKASKEWVRGYVFPAMGVAVSNAVDAFIETGDGLRFFVTNVYTFTSGSTVGVDRAIVRGTAAIGSLESDRAYVGNLNASLVEADEADIVMSSGGVGALDADEFLVYGRLGAASLAADSIATPRFVAGEIASAGPGALYTEVGRSAKVGRTTTIVTTEDNNVPVVATEPGIVTGTERYVVSQHVAPVTSVVETAWSYAETNLGARVVHLYDAGGSVTSAYWEAVAFEDGGALVTNVVALAVPLDEGWMYEAFVFTNSLGGVTNIYPLVIDVVSGTSYTTNVVDLPVFVYGDRTITTTNATPYVHPNPGPVGVVTTSTVVRTFAPGVLFTNAAGRCYIKEPAGIRPSGSGTRTNPFLVTRPENFRWIREDHTPGGKVGHVRTAIDGSQTRYWNDDGYYYYGQPGQSKEVGYGSYWTQPKAVEWTNGVLSSYETWCVQANDIDMTDTFLWSSERWPNGEYVDGFGGISGAREVAFYEDVKNVVPSAFSDEKVVGVYTGKNMVPGNTSYGPGNQVYLRSRYAAETWPNKRFSHRLHYDGGGHQLSGIWVGLNPDAAHQSVGLLGANAAMPTVRNLRIGGTVHGRLPTRELPGPGTSARATVISHPPPTMIIGGLFGFAGASVRAYPTTSYTGFSGSPDLRRPFFSHLDQYRLNTSVSNCVVFMDADIEMYAPWSPLGSRTNNLVALNLGGAVGRTGKALLPLLAYTDDHDQHSVRSFGLHFQDSSFVGRRRVHSDKRGASISVGRLIGSLAGQSIDRSTRAEMFNTYGTNNCHIVDDIVVLNNTEVYAGDGAYETPDHSVYGMYAAVTVSDGFGVNAGWNGGLAYVHNCIAAPPRARYDNAPTEGYYSKANYSNAFFRAGRVGYYGGLTVHNAASTPEGTSGRLATLVSLVGEYGRQGDDYDSARLLPGFRAIAGYDWVVMKDGYSADNTGSYAPVLFSIDGSRAMGAASHMTYANKYVAGSSSVVIASSALRDEGYQGAARSTWGDDQFDGHRFGQAGLVVSSRAQMVKNYVVEPANAVGGGGAVWEPGNPYGSWYDEGWTKPGDLGGWYPVPKDAAGVSSSESARIFSVVSSATTNTVGDYKVYSAEYSVVVEQTRRTSMGFTNRYAVSAAYLSPTSCALSVVDQVYARKGTVTTITTNSVSFTSTNLVTVLDGMITVDGQFAVDGRVSVSGDVVRVRPGAADPFSIDPGSTTVGNEYGVLRVTAEGVFPVATAPRFMGYQNGLVTFPDHVRDVAFEWWPDGTGTNELSATLVSSGDEQATSIDYCIVTGWDGVRLESDASGFVIVRPGSLALGLSDAEAAPTLPSVSAGGAVAQVSFAPALDGGTVMNVLPSTFAISNYYHGAAQSKGVSTDGKTAYIDGSNKPYAAKLYVSIRNERGASLDDLAFFESVKPFCNYSDPKYLSPDAPTSPVSDRLSSHEGVVVYEVVVGQLVTFQAVGGWGTSAMMVLVPEAWPYEE